MNYVWKKPAITFYLERFGKPERKPFLVVEARKLLASKNNERKVLTLSSFLSWGQLIIYLAKKEKLIIVLCWFDDREDDFKRAFRRLTGVTFPIGTTFVTLMNKAKEVKAPSLRRNMENWNNHGLCFRDS